MYPQLVCNPGPISSTLTRPNKDTAVQSFVSRFNKITQPVARAAPMQQELATASSQATPGVVADTQVKKSTKRKKGNREGTDVPQSTTQGKRTTKTKSTEQAPK